MVVREGERKKASVLAASHSTCVGERRDEHTCAWLRPAMAATRRGRRSSFMVDWLVDGSSRACAT